MQTDGVLNGKVALVTGAARGLGLFFAEALIKAGARVTLVARSAKALEEAATRLGPNALAAAADIASPDAVRAAFAKTLAAFGGLDVLVNNATLTFAHRIEDACDGDLQAEFGVNILGAICCIRDAIPLMRARGGGDIVNVSSESVFRPFPLLTTYAAAKAAIETLTVGMREEVRAANIRVTTLRSGALASDGGFMKDSTPDHLREVGRLSAEGGYTHEAGEPIDPRITAQALIDLLRLPREAHVDVIAVRAK